MSAELFLDTVVFDDGDLIVTYKRQNGDAISFGFEYARLNIVFKSSDFSDRLQAQLRSRLNIEGVADVRIFKIERGAIIQDVLEGNLLEDGPTIYLFSSADHCVEVAAFDEPNLRSISESR